MNLEALGQVVAKTAPLLGRALGGPAGEAIGSVIAAKWGGTLDNPEELIQRIQSDPQARLKLVEIQSNHEIELQRIQLIEAETQLKYAYLDKQGEQQEQENARQREATLAQSGKRDITPAILAYLLTLGVLSALYYLFTHKVPTENKELIVAIVSALSTVWIGAMAYYHGSSAGSRAKDYSVFGLPRKGRHTEPKTLTVDNITDISLARRHHNA